MSFFKQPIRLYFSLFIATTMIGSILLSLPFTGRKPISFIDAMYVATSAFTVTGLSTVDVTTQFNIWGDIIIMLLIQIGGMGIITVSMMLLVMTQQHLSYKNNKLLKLQFNIDDIGVFQHLIGLIFYFTLFFETLGTILLAFEFVPTFGWSKGLFMSLFTSVSAFNNAGFSLFPDSLMQYVNQPAVNLIVAFLIIMGGIGYIVLYDLITTRRIKKLQLHSKVTIIMTLLLLVIGTILFFVLEQGHSLKGLSFGEQWLAAFFQSTSARTAGFNTVDMQMISPSTMIMMMCLMFIGAGPISAAGGIKVTTFAVVILFVVYELRGQQQIHILNRSIDNKQVHKALAVTLSAITFVLLIIFGFTLTQPNLSLADIAFEVVSAFGTVGLSTGISASYGTLSKILIIMTMIVGKVGVLSLLMLFQRESKVHYRNAKGNLFM
ncbi:potassium transporter KtrB [Staphylococcus microti]|uniref:Potassium transporter KtrB n=1 Tax=Staphylococcus microti TaxID=569857 RepID=A0A0D6XT31_9STAP|nr:TrkH family potassium uptake protein [Staphylococcus microti]KIX91008.1 potassium transporter KtrB [Staphylococcus microti]PNZ81884.1 potassium transporter KtrB [Staphylococcus microti]SUM57193.1 TrkH family potassium uptake protein [Staphylococcus microti]